MTLPFAAVTLFAEDLRQEVGGTYSIIGVMGDNVEVPSFPGAVPKIAIYTRIHVPTDVKTDSISVVLRFPDGVEHVVNEFDPELLERTRLKAIEDSQPYYGIFGHALASPFPVQQEGVIHAIGRFGDAEGVIGTLNFVKSVEAEPE